MDFPGSGYWRERLLSIEMLILKPGCPGLVTRLIREQVYIVLESKEVPKKEHLNL